MKKVTIISVIGATLLLLYLFSFSLSEEEKITWGGKYPPPPKELTWKEKWERSKLPFMEQDALNASEHDEYYGKLRGVYDTLYYKKMREPVIKLDKNAYKKILRFQRYKGDDYNVEYPINHVLCNGLETNGETLDFLREKYSEYQIVSHEVDTFRYGCPINKGAFEDPELQYMLSKVHYSEVHTVVWIVSKELYIRKFIFFINDNGILRSFWGFQLGKDDYLPDNIFLY